MTFRKKRKEKKNTEKKGEEGQGEDDDDEFEEVIRWKKSVNSHISHIKEVVIVVD